MYYNRRSIRLQEYDYSQAGLYFITLCIQSRLCLFGKISDDGVILSKSGQMIEEWYYKIENKFPDIKCRDMVIMPNHMHFVLQNTGKHVGTDLCVYPDNTVRMCQKSDYTIKMLPSPVMLNDSETSRISQEILPYGQDDKWILKITFDTLSYTGLCNGLKQ